MEEETVLAGDRLDPRLWEVSAEFISDPNLRALHRSVLEGLRRENPEADVLETILMERIASGFIFMKSKEESGQIGGNEYKNLMQLWVSMAADLRKTRTQSSDIVAMKDEITQNFLGAFEDALSGVNMETQMVIRTRMMEALTG